MTGKREPYERISILVDGQSYYSAAAGSPIEGVREMAQLYRDTNPDSEIRLETVRYSDFDRYHLARNLELVAVEIFDPLPATEEASA